MNNEPSIGNKYRFIQQLGAGDFGSIYEGENLRTGEKVAVKVEPIKNQTKLLKNETKIYQYLGNVKQGVPCVKWFGVDAVNNYMVMNLLGESLHDRREKCGRFSLSETARVGIQLVERIKYVHERGLVHRDIKPDNFLFGRGEERDKLYIIDFGFSKRYSTIVDTKTKKRNTIIGTPNFISIAVHSYLEPERKDDLESVMYILLYLYMEELPWFAKHRNERNERNERKELTNEEIKELKSEFLSRHRKETDLVALIVDYIQDIQRTRDRPNYDFYLEQFHAILDKITKK